MRRAAVRAAAGAGVLALVAAGCGSNGGDRLSTGAQSQLAPLVAQVRRAAVAGDRAGAQQALSQLRSAVTADERRGEIGAARAAEVLAAATDVEQQLTLVVEATTTTTTPVTLPADRGNDGEHDHGGHGGRGHQGD